MQRDRINDEETIVNKSDSRQSKTDWTRVDGLQDEDIDYSDIPELGDEFFEKATFVAGRILPEQLPKAAMEYFENSVIPQRAYDVVAKVKAIEEKSKKD